jgi:hypothetical protein
VAAHELGGLAEPTELQCQQCSGKFTARAGNHLPDSVMGTFYARE